MNPASNLPFSSRPNHPSATSGLDGTDAEYRVLPAEAGYDLWAEIYDEEDNPLIQLEQPRVIAQMGDVRGLTIADVGCGTGRHTQWLVAAGASVIGLDFSRGMLERARAKPGCANVDFRQHDLSAPLPFTDSEIDRIVCGLVLEHVSELGFVFAEFLRVLRPGGFAVVSNLHPAMMLRGVSARFTDPRTGVQTRPRSCTHTISDYVNAALQAGLALDHLSEHAVDAALAARSPRSEKYLGWPLLLLMRAARPIE